MLWNQKTLARIILAATLYPTMSSFGNRFKISPTRYEELDGETSLMTSEEQVRLFFF